MRQHLKEDDRILEVGCGTAYRITYLLHSLGYHVNGLDTDEASIRYGQRLLERAGIPSDIIEHKDLAAVHEAFDAIILSEVLEHLSDQARAHLLALVRDRLVAGGKLLVTVPNGYGWYELEDWVWDHTGIGWLLERTKIAAVLRRLKQLVVSGPAFEPIASSLDFSPHVQRFTLQSIQRALTDGGFRVTEATGSVLFCGPFSDLLFTGAQRVMRLNVRLGRRFPARAAGLYVAAVRSYPT